MMQLPGELELFVDKGAYGAESLRFTPRADLYPGNFHPALAFCHLYISEMLILRAGILSVVNK